MSGPGIGVIVLAAGRGTRMKSTLPKVLHPVCGAPMISHIVDAARQLEPARLAVVTGYGGDRVRTALDGSGAVFVDQPELLGTADAVGRCRDAMPGCETILVLNGDSPLIRPGLLRDLFAGRDSAPFSFLSCSVDDPGRLGRVVRDGAGQVAGVVEAADYTGPGGPAEINAGQYCFDANWLWANLGAVPLSAKGEYYLTHLVAIAHAGGRPAVAVRAEPLDVLGVDDRVRLAEAEREMRRRILERHMLAGVTITDPQTTYIDAAVRIAEDVTILPNCHLLGPTGVSANVTIGPGTTLRGAQIGEGSYIQGSVVEESSIGANVRVGPFAHVRGGAVIGDECELGNYAEVKNSNLGRGVKMHHFSYVGDADVGEYANIAAGIITCNFDGVNKHRTVIGAHAFVGSDTMLVAPVTIGEGASTGAGSVVTKDVPPGAKAVGVPARVIGRARRSDG